MKQASNPQTLHRQAMMALSAGKLGEGITLLRQLLASGVENADIHSDLGAAYWQSGQLQGAEAHFAKAFKLDPKNLTALGNYVTLLKKTNRPQQAAKALETALEASPKNSKLWGELGGLHVQLRQTDDAVKCLKQSLSLDPAAEKNWVRLLSCLEAASRLDEAEEQLAAARKIFPASAEIALQESKLLRRRGREADAATLLEKARAELKEDSPWLYSFNFELGQVYDRLNEPDKAFPAFATANAVKLKQSKIRPEDKAAISQTLLRHARDFTPQMAAGPASATNLKTPVFLVGFPRSGTTLMDQILSSCKGVTVAEERDGVYRMLNELGKIHYKKTGRTPPKPQAVQAYADLGFWKDAEYPACLENLGEGDIAALQKVFFDEHSRHADVAGAKVFVDKLPLNIMHAGFIKRVFPEAKFILALRHPCDAVLSCFMQNFGQNLFMSRCLDLGDAARFYDEVFGLWAHFRKTLALDVHESRYEDVVSDFRPTVTGVLDFLGLEWDDAVLEYDKTAREKNIRTPSYHQVTEKIYTRASGRWLRYRQHLAPVLDILKPHAESHGYSIAD